MNVYRITRLKSHYDEYTSVVVVAPTAKEARKVAVGQMIKEASYRDEGVSDFGSAAYSRIKKINTDKVGVVHSAYRNG